MPQALVVDDDTNFALGLAEAVNREGFVTRTAGSVKEAKAEMGKGMPDILLMDLHLPDGSGLDLFKELEASPSTEVVLITGQATVDTAVEALRRGASDYLTKPVDLARVQRGAGQRPAHARAARSRSAACAASCASSAASAR